MTAPEETPPAPSRSRASLPNLQQFGLTIFDRLFNAMFDMTYLAGGIRLVALAVFFIVTWLLFALFSHPFQAWRQAGIAGEERASLVGLLLQILFAPDVVGHMLAILLPFFLVISLAAVFLDDIFELNDFKTARNFITQAAFILPMPRTLRIESGKVRKADERSPIRKIGGPGRVSVSLDSVAVFEKINGQPDIIGPTRGEQFFSRNLDGFERLRNIIDIRDKTMTIEELTGRTKDGLPITVRNIRLLYSVQRSSPNEASLNQSNPTRPFTYTESAILALTYGQFQGDWDLAVTSLVRGELVQFISQHTLAEIFANAGEPEMARMTQAQNVAQRLRERHRARQRRYARQNEARRKMATVAFIPRVPRRFPKRMFTGARQSEETSWQLYPISRRIHLPGRWNVKPAPASGLRPHLPRRPATWSRPVALVFRARKFAPRSRFSLQYHPEKRTKLPFVPRPELSRSFYQQFAREFSNKATDRGVRLEWIDVGAWHAPDDIIIGQHTDAWLLTTENQVRSSPAQLDILRSQARTTEMLRLIRQPVYCYWDLVRKEESRTEIVRQLVEEYLGTLCTVRDDLRENNLTVPETVIPAIRHIERYQRDDSQDRGQGRFVQRP